MILKNLKRELSLLLALLLVGVLPMLELTALAANLTNVTVATGVNATSTGSGNWTSSNGTINGSVAVKVTSGCTGDSYSSQSGTLTITCTQAGILSFDYSLNLNSGSITVDGSAATAGGTFSKTVAANDTVVISLTSANSQADAVAITLSGITLTIDADRTLTFVPSAGGTITANGTTVNSETVFTGITYAAGIPVTATPASGYTFYAWVDETGNVIDKTANTTIKPMSDLTLHAVFFQADAGSLWGVGNLVFGDLTSAISAASAGSIKTVVLLSDGTLPSGNYTVPNGVTVLIPMDAANTSYTSAPSVVYNSYTTPTKFRELTMANGANITVNSGGAISVPSQLSSKGQLGGYNGTPTGPDGRIQMMSGSSITLNNGANLYCWGYIYGSGSIEAKSGATVYEAFQVKDWRGGSATSNVYDYAFIFNQYYIQNIEVPMKVDAGATEKLYSSVNASSSAYPIGATLIGSGGMFQISSGYVVKDYNESKDQLTIEIHGNVTMASLVITGVPMLGSVSTSDYRLPVNDMNIDVHNGGVVNISQDLEFLPGSEITVSRGATFEVTSGKNVYLFDKDDWGNFTGSAQLHPVGYSVANGTTAVRTAANLQDARIDVNGTVDIQGTLYTSNVGADITSTLGYDGTDAKVVFTSAPPNSEATIYEMANNSTKTAVTFYAPKLHNGDDSYSESQGTGTSTWKYDKDGEHWYRYLVDFKYNNTLIQREFFCENGDTVTYDASWLANLGASASSGTAAVSGTNVNVTGVTADCVVTLTGTPAEYIPTFVLNEKQYSIYQLYTGGTISDTVTIGGDTYYIVAQADSALPVGTTYAAPTDADMGVSAANHNDIIWNMSGLSYTSGDPFRGTVPAGETAQGPVYIYGFYDGVVAYNSYTDAYYRTLIDAFDMPSDATATITLLADCGTFEPEIPTQLYSVYPNNHVTLDLNGHHAVGRINNQGVMTLELNGGTLDYETGATAASAGYDKKAAVTNSGTMTVQDSVGGGKITADAIAKTSGIANYSAVIYNNAGAALTVDGVTLENKPASVNNYSTVLDNFGTASISNSTLTTNRGMGLVNGGTGRITQLADSTVSVTLAAGYYGIFNTSGGIITLIDNCTVTTLNNYVVYNTDGSTITTLKDTSLTITTPTTKNTYVVFNYGGTITTIDGCTITGNSGINNRNKRSSAAISAGYALAYRGTIGTIHDTDVTVGQYALYNGGTVNTISGSSTFIAQPASAQVPWPSGTAALNGNVSPYTIVNSNLWWYDSAVWKRTDTSVDNNGTTMLQRRVDDYKTTDEFLPTIGTITDNVQIIAYNTSNSNSYGYYALQNQGVINEISGNVSIRSAKHPNNAKSVYGYYALQNTTGGKIGTIGSGVTISAQNYALSNLGARYSKTDVTYSTTYLASGALKSGGLATDYDYTYADVSYIGSTAATVTATSQYAILNYSKIGSITGSVSANYNVIVNAGAAATTTGIEGTTANARAIEHRYFEGDDSSTTANEYRRYFEYTRNTTDGCYIGSIDATVTATGSGYQAVTNQGYIGTLAGTVTTPTGKATSSSTYYPLIFNGNMRQATLKQTEDYYVETNDAGATKYVREYTCAVPTIDTVSCTATNPQDYTLQNYGQINNLTGSISGKTITVANEAAGPFLTRKTLTFYSSATRLAASKASTEVNIEYTKQPAEITNITGATIKTTGGTVALRNYGHVGTISGSTITSSTTGTITNGSSTITEYTSNRDEVLTGCVPNGTSSCALAYDMSQTIDEDEVRVIGTIDTIGAGNYIQGTGKGIDNTGRINTIDSGEGATTIIYTSGSATNVYNNSGQYTRRTNTAATLTNTTGTLTNNYSYEYVPAYIGTIKNVFILSKQNAIMNGAAPADANYDPVTIGEIGEGAELRTTATATYSAVQNSAANAKIELISGGVFMTGTGSGIYGLNNAGTAYPIHITGGDFRGGNATRALAINDADNPAKYTYPDGLALSPEDDMETATYHTLSNKVLTAKTNDYYYLAEAGKYFALINADGTESTEAYATLQEAMNASSGDLYVRLLKDMPAGTADTMNIGSNVHVYIDLNGHTLRYGGTIANSGHLCLIDSSSNSYGAPTGQMILTGSGTPEKNVTTAIDTDLSDNNVSAGEYYPEYYRYFVTGTGGTYTAHRVNLSVTGWQLIFDASEKQVYLDFEGTFKGTATAKAALVDLGFRFGTAVVNEGTAIDVSNPSESRDVWAGGTSVLTSDTADKYYYAIALTDTQLQQTIYAQALAAFTTAGSADIVSEIRNDDATPLEALEAYAKGNATGTNGDTVIGNDDLAALKAFLTAHGVTDLT